MDQLKKTHIHNHLKHVPDKIKVGIVIVSTTRFNEKINNFPSSDKCTPIIKKILSEYKFEELNTKYVIEHELIIADDPKAIINSLNRFVSQSENKLDMIVYSGGTGITKKDVTIETISPHFQKELVGFGELFRSLSYNEIGVSSILSRATAGIIKDTVVFLIPGSQNAVKMAFERIIAKELPHIVSEIHREKY